MFKLSDNNIIAVVLFFIIIGTVFAVRFSQARSKNPEMSLDDIITEYGDQIVKVLNQAIAILTINSKDYTSQEEYEKAIINVTITSIKENTTEFQSVHQLLSIFETEALSNAIYNILHTQISKDKYDLTALKKNIEEPKN